MHCCLQTPTAQLTDERAPPAPNDLMYTLMCESKSLRRGRNFRVVAMSIDPTSELSVTVATSDGRLQVRFSPLLETTDPSPIPFVTHGLFQFLSIAPGSELLQDVWPSRTLLDVVKSIDPEKL